MGRLRGHLRRDCQTGSRLGEAGDRYGYQKGCSVVRRSKPSQMGYNEEGSPPRLAPHGHQKGVLVKIRNLRAKKAQKRFWVKWVKTGKTPTFKAILSRFGFCEAGSRLKMAKNWTVYRRPPGGRSRLNPVSVSGQFGTSKPILVPSYPHIPRTTVPPAPRYGGHFMQYMSF